MRMAAVIAQQPGMGNCTGRADNTQKNTNQEDLLIQEYCIPAKMSKLFLPRCQKWPRAFPCKYLKLLSNLLKASSSTVSSVPPAITPAQAASLAASAPAPSLAAPVLQPGRRCFLLQGGLW